MHVKGARPYKRVMSEPIEEHMAHLQKEVEELSTIVARQDAEITRLTRLVDLLVAQVTAREAEGTGGVILGDERPPHY